MIRGLETGAKAAGQALKKAKEFVNKYIVDDVDLAAEGVSEGLDALAGEGGDAREPTHPVTVTHKIKHTSFWAALAGAVAGALATALVAGVVIVSAKFLAAAAGITAVAGGLVFAGKVAVFVAAGLTVGDKVNDWVTKTLNGTRADDGPVIAGSPDVFIAGRPAGRAGIDPVACTKHVRNPPPRIAEGSKTVRVNGYPLARIDDRVECGAPLKEGVISVWIGGPTDTVLDVAHEFNWFQRAVLFAAELLIPPTGGLRKLLRVNFSKLYRGIKEGVEWAATKLTKFKKQIADLTSFLYTKTKNALVDAARWSAQKASEVWKATKTEVKRAIDAGAEMLKSAKVKLSEYKDKVVAAAHKGAEATKSTFKQLWDKLKGPPSPPSPPPSAPSPPASTPPPPPPPSPPPTS